MIHWGGEKFTSKVISRSSYSILQLHILQRNRCLKQRLASNLPFGRAGYTCTPRYFRNTGVQCRSTKETRNQFSAVSSAHSLVHTSAKEKPAPRVQLSSDHLKVWEVCSNSVWISILHSFRQGFNREPNNRIIIIISFKWIEIKKSRTLVFKMIGLFKKKRVRKGKPMSLQADVQISKKPKLQA